MNEPRTLVEWCHVAWQNSKDHGFHDVPNDGTPERMPERMALLHCEVSELFEAFRKNPHAPCDKPGLQLSAAAEELADIVIRLFDYVVEFRISPEGVFETSTFATCHRQATYAGPEISLGQEICTMHKTIDLLGTYPYDSAARLFMQCVHFAKRHSFDLELAVQTKHAYNVHRPHMHGTRF